MTDFIPTTEHSVTGKPPVEGLSYLRQEAFPVPGETAFKTTLVAQAQFLTPNALSDPFTKGTTLEGGDKKTTPIVDQNLHTNPAGTAHERVTPNPGAKEVVPEKTESKPDLDTSTTEKLNSIEKLSLQHLDQSGHMIGELNKASNDSQQDKSFLTAINLSSTLVVPTAEGGKAVLVGSIATGKDSGPGATYENAQGDKLTLAGNKDEEFYTKFKDGCTDFGVPNGDIVLDKFGNVFVFKLGYMVDGMPASGPVFDSNGNPSTKEIHSLEAIRTSDGKIFVRAAGNQGWQESHNPNVQIMSADQIKELYAGKEKP